MTPTIAAAWAAAQAAGVARIDAQRLLARLVDRPRAWLIAHDDWPLPAALFNDWQVGIARLADDVPLAQLLGEHEFRGLTLRITPDVLVPRADTETLVEWAVELLRQRPRAEVVDLGTGSGAVALALASAVPDCALTATDASDAALAVAADNARRLRLPLRLAAGDWWQAVGDREFDLAVSNPPYVAASDPHLHALRHEPPSALIAGPDGLAAIRQIVAGARHHLRAGAWLLVEHGWNQAAAVRALFDSAGFGRIERRRDLGGCWRCTGGQRT